MPRRSECTPAVSISSGGDGLPAARYDWSERAINPLLKDKSGSAILTYWPSEFSQIRGQYRRTDYAEGVTANELLFQFLFSIGAHGAHVF